ncbi:hypothetical protein PV08_02890 [Exophiala spinifera]|uniref:Uncharacterized protein n=1 Tax=Exophiala spinifera TaxID=91928 RepID=A0A0D1YTP0_9EURO|nr:uncharacterized protein PV08_02890 [Exophiala spinifera]KIW18601.1 hypothetical protein PV08_02890 [Exophiala spinifera]
MIPASRIPSRAELTARTESSLSYPCDPDDQPPACSEGGVARNGGVAQSSDRKEDFGATQGLSNKRDNIDRVQEASALRSRRLFRPLSWLPWSQSSPAPYYPRSQSVHLSKAPSISTVARSVISAPILTSTTNMDVARAEGVLCGEMSDMTFGRTRWDPVAGWIDTSLEEEPGNGTSFENPRSKVPRGVARVSKSPKNMTRLKKGRIVKLGDIIRKKVKAVPVRFRSREAGSRIVSSNNESSDEHAACGSSDKHVQVGMLNLYKGKMRGLTENGHYRRKSLNSSKGLAKAQQDPPLLGDFTNEPILDTEAGPELSDNEESVFGSLTKSFASAVDRLDFHSPLRRNLPLLKSQSSFFTQTKACNGDEAGCLDRQRQSPAMIAPTLEPDNTSRVSAVAAVSEPVKTAVNDLAMQNNAPTPVLFSTEPNQYVDAKPLSGNPCGVNPLRMHPPGAFANPPSAGPRMITVSADAAPSPPEQQTPKASNQCDEDGDMASLQDAPIYSPSLGDLSHYARDTPPSHQRRRTETSRPAPTNPTPTRAGMLPARKTPIERHGTLLKKSRSGLFSISKSSKTINPRDNGTASPLHHRDVNQQVKVNQERTVKKSRSLQFGGLFRKNSQPNSGKRAPSEVPFQPTTPSPLRNVTRVSHGSDKTSGKVDNGLPPMRFTKK